MPQEVELKLRIPQSQARRVPKHPLLADLAPERHRLINTYFDTPDLALRRRGIGLRHRRRGELWLMTVKGDNPAQGGLARRNEWEAPTEPGEFDFSIVDDPDLRDFLTAQRERLEPIFTTDFTRLAWTLERGDSTLELVLDRGHIDSGHRQVERLALCELEIEQIKGESLDPLFDLARELAQDFHLHPDIASKAERGYRLFTGAAMTPVKASPSPLTGRMSPVEGFRAVALDCLGHLQRNEAGVVIGEEAEFIHQARVAVRRLRSAQKLFAPQLPEAFVDANNERWRDLTAPLGEARDWDVFLADTLAPLAARFPEAPELAAIREATAARRVEAGAAARQALLDPGYSRQLLDYTAALFRLPDNGGKLRRFARKRLRRYYEKVVKLAKEHNRMSADERHQLRIAFKQLRYATEFFAPLLPRRRTARWRAALVRIQDVLGHLNDLATATRLIAEAGRETNPAMIHGWIAGQEALLLKALKPALEDFAAAREPWN